MIFDTNIFIYADRGVLTAKELIMNTDDRAISAVTYMEYIPFCRNKKELLAFEKLLNVLEFKIYDIDAVISFQARQMVKQFALSHSMEMADALIHTITHIFLSINISWLASEEWIAFKSLRRILIHKKQKIRHKPWFGCFLHLKSATY